MELHAFITIVPKQVEAGKALGSNGWFIGGAFQALPAQLAPMTKVARITIEVPDDEFEVPKMRVTWPSGKITPDIAAELESWTK